MQKVFSIYVSIVENVEFSMPRTGVARMASGGSDFDWGCFYLNLLIEYQSINRISLRSTMKSPLILLIDTNWHHHFMHVAPDVVLCVHEQLAIEIVILRR